MAKLLRLRRGTTSQHSSFTGAEGEVTIDTDKEVPVVHDGSTAGGHPVAAEDMANVSSASITGRLASGSIAGAKIADGAITSAHIAADTVVAADIAANAIGSSELAGDAVTGTHIADNSIDSEHYVDASIDHVHLANDCIDGDNIQDDVINSEHYAAGSIDHEHLAADCVDGDNIANDSINSEHYVDGSIDRAHLAADIIDGTKIADNAIAGEHIADDAVGANEIANNAVDQQHIAANAVGASELADNAVDTNAIVTDSITQAKIQGNSINEERLQISNSGSNGQFLQRQSGNTGGLTWATVDTSIADGSITSAKIQDGTIATGDLANDCINADKLADDCVGAEHIGNNAINNAAMIADSTITSAKVSGGLGTIIDYTWNHVTSQNTINSGNNFDNLSAYQTSITPKSTSSRIKITVHIHMGQSGHPGVQIFRGSTMLGQASANGSRRRSTFAGDSKTVQNCSLGALSFTYVDHPNTTSSITYYFKISSGQGHTMRINYSDYNQAHGLTAGSSVLLEEYRSS